MRKIKRLLAVFAYLLLLYLLLRCIFFLRYFHSNEFTGKNILLAYYWGLRIDISALFYINLPFILCYFFLFNWLPALQRKRCAVWLPAIINLPWLAVNMIDLVYFRFNLRRSTIDLLSVLPGSVPAIPGFIKAWWWVLGLFLLLSIISVAAFNYIFRAENGAPNHRFLANLAAAACFLLPLGILARGWSERPIIPSTTLLYLPVQMQPLATNSTFTFLYSIVKRQTRLKEKDYFSPGQLQQLFTARKSYPGDSAFRSMNVVLLVLESFAKEYVTNKDPLRAATPFLDSIMAQSIVCNNAFANGQESNKGLVAILASLPPFFDEPFYNSPYGNNRLRGIGSILKEKGYNTSFFMGAGYDHFGFARLARIVGIDKYYSMRDYGNNQHFDGNWGIFDHYFLPYAARQMDAMQKPFFSTVFTISTHAPYTLPDSLRQQFTLPGQGIEQNSMSYLDYSLRLFFNEIKNKDWYKNTLFVFTADHNIFWYQHERFTLYKSFEVPIFFYLPGQPRHQEINAPVQQLDVVPSILHLLHYPQPFMSFGQSVFDSSRQRLVINHFSSYYQLIDSSFLLGYNESTERTEWYYNYKKDPALQHNLFSPGVGMDSTGRQLQQALKARLQYFNDAMIKNTLYIK
ncbi:MAG TPA: sulfatase-like hydrolase/transferase [Chitinophagaceae bacterium]|nr:sulfatase-like hydrolase/transferase [Chitinophagaceae bacterium]